MVEVQLSAVQVDLQTKNPVVLLQEREGARTLPIFIGPAEARAIALVLEGHVPERPLTHDLIRDLLGSLSARLERLVITELRDKTYLAEMHLDVKGEAVVVSCRPSDGIAVALRTQTRMYVDDDLIEAEGIVLQADSEDEDDLEAEEPEELVEHFREFIQAVRPEDFA
ncbi:MAG TPA: bifunctional nuclease family protein [Acidimicrobiales bacterium]|nr:bifunctional nuclease family protein [Acidimicrobiales bacterium]